MSKRDKVQRQEDSTTPISIPFHFKIQDQKTEAIKLLTAGKQDCGPLTWYLHYTRLNKSTLFLCTITMSNFKKVIITHVNTFWKWRARCGRGADSRFDRSSFSSRGGNEISGPGLLVSGLPDGEKPGSAPPVKLHNFQGPHRIGRTEAIISQLLSFSMSHKFSLECWHKSSLIIKSIDGIGWSERIITRATSMASGKTVEAVRRLDEKRTKRGTGST